ncbi:hypothetical protein CsSME_00019070 [Camellia sinensis var. sinensis]
MALVPAPATDGPLFAEVDMGGSDSAPTVRATMVQASTAASFGSQLVMFPEAFVGGYPRGSNFGVTIGNCTAKGKEEFRKYHAAAIDVPGPEVHRLAAMAGKYKDARGLVVRLRPKESQIRHPSKTRRIGTNQSATVCSSSRIRPKSGGSVQFDWFGQIGIATTHP